MKENALISTWSDGGSALGLWLSSNNGVSAESLGAVGFDYVNIDMQHGVVDYGDVVPLLQALAGTSSTLLARVPWNEPGIIGKVLDAGVQGVIIPMVNTVDQALAATRSCRYAPVGSRSFGPIRAARSLGPDYYGGANDQVACIPMIETAEALENLDDILDVPGIDAVYVGPADLSISLGLPPGANNDDTAFQDALAAIVAACDARGIPAGIHADATWTPVRLEQGFRMVTVISDTQAVVEGAAGALQRVRAAASGAEGDDAGTLY
ncbi:MAG: aldolase/citrate lyase family protein [Actinomycetota bacterium]